MVRVKSAFFALLGYAVASTVVMDTCPDAMNHELEALENFNPMGDDYKKYSGNSNGLVTPLYIGRIPTHINESKLIDLLSKYGNVVNTRLCRSTNENFNYAIISYSKNDEALRAISMLHQKKPYNLDVRAARSRKNYTSYQNNCQSLDYSSADSEPVGGRLPFHPSRNMMPRCDENINIEKTPEVPNNTQNWNSDYAEGCSVCSKPASTSCEHCAIKYCSDKCKSANWRRHQITCQNMKNSTSQRTEYGILSQINCDDLKSFYYQLAFQNGKLKTDYKHKSGSEDSGTCQTRNISASAFNHRSQHDRECSPKYVPKLPKPILTDSYTNVYMTCIDDPLSFYVRLSKEDKLSNPLQKLIDGADQPDESFQVNNIVAAKFKEDNKWYRSKILNLNANGSCTVDFIDYGNVGYVVLSEIRALPPALLNEPRQVLHCRLANIPSKNTNQWTVKEMRTFQSLIQDKTLRAKNVKEVDGITWVHLCDEFNNDIGDIMSPKPIRKSCTDDWQKDSCVETIISDLVDSGRLWVTDNTKGELSSGKLRGLTTICNTMMFNKFDQFQVGLVVAAQECSGNRHWHRAVILETLKNGYLVQYLDYGNTEKVTQLRPLPEEYKTFPAFAVLIQALSLTDRIYTEEFTCNDQLKFKVTNHQDLAKIVTLENDSLYFATSVWFEVERYTTKLRNKSNGNRLDSDLLKDVSSRNGDAGLQADVPSSTTNVEVPFCKMNGMSRPTSTCAATTPEEPVIKSFDAREKNVSSCNKGDMTIVRSSPPETRLKTKVSDFELLPPIIIPLTGVVAQMVPVDLYPEGIHVQIFSEETAAIWESLERINDICEVENENRGLVVNLPSVSQMFFGKSTDDDKWYRCVVRKVISKDAIEVTFIDYGNTATINLNRLMKIHEQFLKFPPMAVCVRLADINSDLVKDAWKILVVEDDVKWQLQVVDSKSRPVPVIIQDSHGVLLKDKLKKFSVKLLEPLQYKESTVLESTSKSGSSFTPPPVRQMELTKQEFLTEASNDPVSNPMNYSSAATLPVGKTLDVIFMSVLTPLQMFCWSEDNSDKLDQLTIEMAETLDNERPSEYFPLVEEMCIAKFKEDGSWYRAICLSSGETCSVLFVDYGNIEEVEYRDIRPMSQNFLELPTQAIFCVLHGVPEIFDFNDEQNENFKSLIPLNKPIEIEVVEHNKEYYKIRIPSIERAARNLGIIN